MTDREIIRACLPDTDGVEAEPVGEGDFARAYRVGGRIVRIPKHPEARAALEREACLLPALVDALPVPVPIPSFIRAGERAVAAVHDELPGEELWRERWEGLAERDRRRLAGDVGRFLRRLHDLGSEPAAACGLREAAPGALASRITRRLESHPGPIPTQLRDPLARHLAELRADDMARHPRALLHGDLGPGHTLIDTGTLELSGVIDWGDAFVGDPARDFIFIYEDWGDDFLAWAVEAYEPADPLPFTRRTYLHYLADQLEWTLRAATHRERAVAEGVKGLARVLEDLARIRRNGG